LARKTFFGLLVDFAKEEKANLLIRGIRSVSDFEYEINLSNINKTLAPNIETVFLPTSPELGVVSSSAVKEIAKYGGDISKFAPPYVAEQLKKQFGFIKFGNE
jgi:pantetheine-phosphate adenylyltransferase